MHVLPNRECLPRPMSFWLLIFFNQTVGSIACYVTRPVGTLNAINHCNQRCLGNSDPQQQIVIKMLWYQWGIVCKQSNVSEWGSECVYVMTIFISTLVDITFTVKIISIVYNCLWLFIRLHIAAWGQSAHFCTAGKIGNALTLWGFTNTCTWARHQFQYCIWSR